MDMNSWLYGMILGRLTTGSSSGDSRGHARRYKNDKGYLFSIVVVIIVVAISLYLIFVCTWLFFDEPLILHQTISGVDKQEQYLSKMLRELDINDSISIEISSWWVTIRYRPESERYSTWYYLDWEYKILPNKAVDTNEFKDCMLTSSDPNIVEIRSGRIVGVKPGRAEVKVETPEGLTFYIQITVCSRWWPF